MTATRHRRLRIIWEPETKKPWIVQYDNQPTRAWVRTWTDAFRFDSYMRATNYVREINERDRVLLEAQR